MRLTTTEALVAFLLMASPFVIGAAFESLKATHPIPRTWNWLRFDLPRHVAGIARKAHR